MSTKTTNYEFVKPALSDAPPDITATNGNWDTVDSELHGKVSKSGDTMTGNLTLSESVLNVTHVDDGTTIKGETSVNVEKTSSRTKCTSRLTVEDKDGDQYGIEVGSDSVNSGSTYPTPMLNFLDAGTRTPIYYEGFKPFEVGTYTGDGTESKWINLPFTPSAVLFTNSQGLTYDTRNNVFYGAFLPWGKRITIDSIIALELMDFMSSPTLFVKNKQGDNVKIASNEESQVYYYILFR